MKGDRPPSTQSGVSCTPVSAIAISDSARKSVEKSTCVYIYGRRAWAGVGTANKGLIVPEPKNDSDFLLPAAPEGNRANHLVG